MPLPAAARLVGAMVFLGPAALPAQQPALLDGLAWDAPAIETLPRALREVSGLALGPGGALYAHHDEGPSLFRLDGGRATPVPGVSGPPRADVEDIALVGDRLFLLTSDGLLFDGRLDGPLVREGRWTDTKVGTRCELEGLAPGAAPGTLLLACKAPRTKALRGRVAIVTWDLARRMPRGEPLLVAARELARAAGTKDFHPSALVRVPATGHLLLLAGPERAIAEVTADGRIVAARRLPRHHRQPEGLVLRPDGTLLIADEGGRGDATLTRYAPRR